MVDFATAGRQKISEEWLRARYNLQVVEVVLTRPEFLEFIKFRLKTARNYRLINEDLVVLNDHLIWRKDGRLNSVPEEAEDSGDGDALL